MTIYIKGIIRTLLLYPIVLLIKYRRKVITDAIGSSLKSTCMEIDYEEDHVPFLLQSVSTYSVSAIATKLKSLTARELFLKHPEIKKEL